MSGIFTLCCCIPSTPINNDPRSGFANAWQIDMGNSPCKEPGYFFYSIFCAPCSQCQLRKKALGGKLDEYKCCQGYFDNACFKSGSCGEASNPKLCLCMEATCCMSCSVSATRFLIMDKYGLTPDPCDNRIIRFNNWVQLISCIVSIIAIFVEELREASRILRLIAECIYCTTLGCMSAQQWRELNYREHQFDGTFVQNAPPIQGEMCRNEYEMSCLPSIEEYSPDGIPVVQAIVVEPRDDKKTKAVHF